MENCATPRVAHYFECILAETECATRGVAQCCYSGVAQRQLSGEVNGLGISPKIIFLAFDVNQGQFLGC